ncbi:MAG TPA: hypothetical protein VFI30_08865 [Nocardioidaceae bacterium]|nr:hypothetical protein [Nocardioidaceae bacterium]
MARPVPDQQWDVPWPANGQRPWTIQQRAADGGSQPATSGQAERASLRWDGQRAASGQTQPADSASPLLIDCASCAVRGTACGDCVVTVLLGGPPAGVELADDERQALDVLAGAGLIPPLRAAPPSSGRPAGH